MCYKIDVPVPHSVLQNFKFKTPQSHSSSMKIYVLIILCASFIGYQVRKQAAATNAVENLQSSTAKTPTNPPSFEFTTSSVPCSVKDNLVGIIMKIDDVFVDTEVFSIGEKSTPEVAVLHKQTLSTPRDRGVITMVKGETVTLTSALCPEKSWQATFRGQQPGGGFNFSVK